MSSNSSSEINRIFQLQSNSENLQDLKNTSLKVRLEKIRRIENFLLDKVNVKSLIDALHSDLKKPEEESLTNEYVPVLINITHILKHLKLWMRDESVEQPITYTGLQSFIRFEPKGNVLIISPWNYPFQLTINPMLHAIAAGNAVIIKPSEYSAATSSFIKKMIEELFNKKEICIIEGDSTVSTALLKNPFNHIHFTGSPVVGKIVMEAAAINLASVTLELGGKSPLIIDENTDIKWAAEKTIWAKTMNCGQTCIAPDYLLIHESLKNDFVKEYKNSLVKFYSGNSNSPLLAKIINQKHAARLRNLIDDAVAKGAQIISGGNINDTDLYIEPTLIDNVNLNMSVMKDEIFGPVLPVLTFKKIDEAVKIVSSIPKPLVLYILSKSKKNIEFILNNTSAGTSSVNELMLTVTNPYLPFGGINNSGLGKSNGKYSFKSFSNERGIVKRKWGTIKMLYPPYNKTIINLLIKLARL